MAIYNEKILDNTSSLLELAGATFTVAAPNTAVQKTAGKLEVSDSLFIGNQNPNVYGGAVITNCTTTISGSTFSGNSAKGGGAIYSTGTLTISNSYFFNNTGASSNYSGAVYIYTGSAKIENSLFSGNNAGYAGAIYAREAGAKVTVSGSTFATASDKIYTAYGSVEFAGKNILNASASGNLSAANAEFVFSNSSAITIANIGGTVKSVTFDGTQTVTLTDQDLSGVAITVTAGLLTGYQLAGGKYIIASGVAAMPETITVAGQENIAVNGGQVTLGGETFTLSFAENQLAVSYSGKQHTIYAPEATGGVWVGDTLYKGTYVEKNLSGNSGVNDGAAININGEKVVVSNSTLQNNYVTSMGGAIKINNGSMIVDGSVFDSNVSNTYGGGIFINNGSLTVSNTKFTGNEAKSYYGGALYVYNGSISITDTLFSGNKASTNGGAIYAREAGAKVTVSGSTFATASDTILTTSGSVTFKGENVINANITGANISADNAGFVFSNSTAITIANIGGTVNSVTFDGSQTVTLTDQDLSSVAITVTVDLLAAFAESPFVIASGISAMGENITVNGEIVALDSGFTFGNGVYSFAFDAEKKELSVRYEGTAYDIYAPAEISGAVVNGIAYRGNYVSNTLPAEAITADSVISSINSSSALVIGNDTDKVFTGITGSVFSNVAGSAVSVKSNSSAVISGTLFDNNESAADGGALVVGVGSGASAVITGSTMSNNRAASLGGAIKLNRNNLEIVDSLLVSNSATGKGGALNINEGSVSITNSTLAGNASDSDGGAIFVRGDEKNPQLTVTGSILADNSAVNGGAIMIGSGKTVVSDSEFTGNQAAADGGAIYNNATLEVSNSIFSGNKTTGSSTYGGAIYNNGTATVTGSLFTGNSTGYYGGAINAGSGSLKVSGSTFSNNGCVERGGGAIHVSSGALVVENSLFANNYTGSNSGANFGGAIYVNQSAGNIRISGSTFSGNSASAGGAIFVYTKNAVYINDCIFATDSDTVSNGIGNVYVSGKNTFNASILGAGTYNIAANSSLTFGSDISVSALNIGENVSFIFSGANVTFTGQDLSSVAITVDGTDRQAGDIIATGVTGLLGADDIVANNSDVYLAIDESGNLVLKANTEISGVTANGTAFFGRAEGDGSGISVTISDAAEYNGTVRAGSAFGTDSVIKSTVTGGTFNNNLYGGGMVSAAKTDITVSGTTEVKQILYGGIFVKDQTEATDLGESNLTVAGGTFNHNVVGGSRVDVNENALNVTHTTAKVNLTISGGNFAKKGTSTDPGVAVYSAGYVNGRGEKEPASTGYDYKVNENTVVINGGVEIKGAVYGGVFACQGGKAYVGNVSISVENAKVDRILGGGWAQTGGKSDVGTVSIAINSGAQVGIVYAGGGNAKVGNTEVFGKVDETIKDVAITVDGGDVGEIFMGGRYNKSVVTGAVVVTIESEADGTISRISGKNGYGVRLENAGRTELVVNSGLTVGMLDSVDKLTIAEGKTLNITDSFSYDDGKGLIIDFDLGENGVFDGESEWTVMTGVTLDDIANVKFAINGTEITGITDGVLGESGYKFEYGNNTLKFMLAEA